VSNLYIYSESFEGPNFYIMPAILYSHLHLWLPSGPLCSDLQNSMPYITTNWCRKQTQLHNISYLCITKRCHIVIPSLWSSWYRNLTTFMSWNLEASIFWNPLACPGLYWDFYLLSELSYSLSTFRLWHVSGTDRRIWVWCLNCLDWLTYWLRLGSRPHGPDAPRLYMTGPLCPISIYGIPVALLKFQMAPRLILLMSCGSKKNEPKYTCLSEARVSHSQRMWAEVSTSAPHLPHSGLSNNPIRWRCLLRVLCPVRRPVTAPDCVLLKDRNLALAPRQGPEISSRDCLWVSPRPRHHTQCWLTKQSLILLRISRLETPKAGSGPTNFRAGPPLELVGDFLSSYSSMSRDPVQLQRIPGRDIFQRLLALLDQWRRSDGL